MANVNISKEPNTLASGLSLMASDSPIYYVLESDQISASGSKAIAVIIVSSAAPGDSITVNGYTITGSATPGHREYSTVGSTASVAASIAFTLKEIPQLTALYDIITIGGAVGIVAKFEGTKYNLTVTATGSYLIFVSAGVDQYRGQTLDNYGVWVELYVELQGLFGDPISLFPGTLIQPQERRFQSDNQHVFDISPILKNYVQSEIPLLDLYAINVVTDSLVAYHIRYGEFYSFGADEPPKKFQVGETEPKWAIKASFPRLDDPDMTDYYDPSLAVKFLTRQPSIKQVFPDRPDFLYFMNSQYNSGTWAVTVIATLLDGTTTAEFVAAPTVSAPGKGLCYSQINPSYWNYQAYETASGGKFKRFKARISRVINGGGGSWSIIGAVTDFQEFEIIRECHETKNTFVFLNSLGGFESVTFTGENVEEINRDITTFIRPSEVNVSHQDRVESVLNVEQFSEYTSNSGWNDSTHMQWLKELLKSPTVYYYDPVNNELLYVIIEKQKWETNSEDAMSSLEITWRFTVDENTLIDA